MLVDIFIEVEDKNFALFNYVNELNNDIEMQQEGKSGIKDDIEQFKSQSAGLEQERKRVLRDLEVCSCHYLCSTVIFRRRIK